MTRCRTNAALHDNYWSVTAAKWDAFSKLLFEKLQLTGHAKRETLAIYQHIALDGQVDQRYQDAMKDVGL